MLRFVDFDRSASKCFVALVCGLSLAACSGSDSDDSPTPPAIEAPAKPVNIDVDAGDTVVVFNIPEPINGGPVFRYTVSCEATDEDTVTAFSGVSPVTLSGMVNDVTYTCSLVASNTAGEAAADPLSVTPSSGFTVEDCTQETTDGDRVTCLTGNWLAELTTAQRNVILVDLSETNAVNSWSGRSVGAFTRSGISFSSMTDEEDEAALAIIEALLSDQGEATLANIRASDAELGETVSGHSAALYYFTVLGTPNKTDPWILLFTGNHYNLMASIEGEVVSLTPNFVGVEPLSFEVDDTTITPLADRQAALVAMLASLGSSERSTANLGETFDDILVGPRDEDKFPETKEGLAVSGLTTAQRDLVIAAIREFTDDQQGMELTADYITDAALDETFIAWSTDETLEDQGAYVRIDGPRVWIEFAVVAGEATSDDHYHSIWRDREFDYGGFFDLTD